MDDTLLIHYGQEFEHIAKLFDHVSGTYVWAHDLVTLHYSDDDTDYPALFQLWKPVEVEKLEAGLRAAQVPLRANKEALKESEPCKWRSYVLGVWQRQQKKHPDLRELYDSKLIIAQNLLQQWVADHPNLKLPVAFDSWFTQLEFCRFLDKTLRLPYVGTLAETDKILLKSGQDTLGAFAERLKQEHLNALQHVGKTVFQKIRIPFKGEHEIYYSYCETHRFPGFGKQRLVTPALAAQVQVSTIARLIYPTIQPFSHRTCGGCRCQQSLDLASHRHHSHTCTWRKCRCSSPPLAR